MGFIEGWCSVKKFWWLVVGILDYNVDLIGKEECNVDFGVEVLLVWIIVELIEIFFLEKDLWIVKE